MNDERRTYDDGSLYRLTLHAEGFHGPQDVDVVGHRWTPIELPTGPAWEVEMPTTEHERMLDKMSCPVGGASAGCCCGGVSVPLHLHDTTDHDTAIWYLASDEEPTKLNPTQETPA